ncbi:2,3-bisphosphoglycerate-independent phosphoglycerate mutase [Terriglobus saanensis]|uniref:2,3-bisphosphoglycerate-independent phosphoglycerate mutase n=1 Tax=Terriglobus saanensis (strain ATCC BAA-1853 / DSM 23119 / SP1PR4) TaxID=401053 RepID=E8V1P2_TERSS|nr:2,3-bisphosphoglycerate-independent phosphoglycerate mutase [Terriglobus saanensis]ADV82323.1 phosphoglycerate mutase, 2,3-bisphosphoglycerate-independent [Terriglobus saanensis SP1PR4]
MAKNRPLILTVLDGWGIRAETRGNAIALARKPNYDRLLREFPNTTIRASDHYVGLPDGQMGNSEVGHLNLGAGRIVRMDIVRIDDMVTKGSFFEDELLVGAVMRASARGRSVHLMGLLSDGGVHAHVRHLYALLKLCKQQGVERVYVHAFLDGRDTLPTSGVGFIEELEQKFREIGVGELASCSGRYFAMDRDLKWEREKKAFDAMVADSAEGGSYKDPATRVRECYSNGVTDEFVIPFLCLDEANQPIGRIRDEDLLICFNYRADRVRQITRVLARNIEGGLTKDNALDLPKAEELDLEIPRSRVPKNIEYVTMTRYDPHFRTAMVIPPESMDNLLANVMAQANLRNLRVAETEKYAHVTYFFNGGIEKPFPGEEREMVQSQKVATYDLAPEMSANGIADNVIKALNDTAFDVIVVNFANADMVGHSGKIDATVKGVETVDACLGRIHQELRRVGGSWLITADHGNAEMLIDPATGGPHTAHTTNPVPFICVTDEGNRIGVREGGSLRDISPTMLGMMGIPFPKEMTGMDLRVKLF